MASGQVEEAGYQLRKLMFSQDPGLAALQPWLWEAARWHELAVAIVSQVSDLPQQDVREIITLAASLDLLDVERLARAERAATRETSRLTEVLTDEGLSDAEAERSVRALVEIASGLERHFDALHQRYLRHYGELMLDELERWFTVSAMSSDELRMVFTYWLQNILGMPLSLVDEHVQIWCRENEVEPADLIAAADRQGINLAFVDDMAERFMTTVRRNTEPASGGRTAAQLEAGS
ncbi:MAG: hypothetical protein WCG47_32390 [Dermatophilaceae bacterium]